MSESNAPPYPSKPPAAGKDIGEKYAEQALIFGIVGLIVAGIILGPLAVITAKKAEIQGVNASTGRILGWAATALAIASIAGAIGFGCLFLLSLP